MLICTLIIHFFYGRMYVNWIIVNGGMKMETIDIEIFYKCVETYGLLPVLAQLFSTLKVSIALTAQTCNMAIKDMDLSVRSYNALMAHGVKDLGKLVDLLNSGNLRDVRNLGVKSAKEIQLKALEYSYEALNEQDRKGFLENLLKINCD